MKTKVSDTGIILSIVIVLLFIYVYQRVQIFRLGYKIRDIDKQIKALEKDNSFLHLEVYRMLSPAHISAEVNRLGLMLAPPKEKQIRRIKETKAP